MQIDDIIAFYKMCLDAGPDHVFTSGLTNNDVAKLLEDGDFKPSFDSTIEYEKFRHILHSVPKGVEGLKYVEDIVKPIPVVPPTA